MDNYRCIELQVKAPLAALEPRRSSMVLGHLLDHYRVPNVDVTEDRRRTAT